MKTLMHSVKKLDAPHEYTFLSVAGITTVLNLAAVGITVREGLPRVPYATAMDVFLIMCLLYATAALIEYAAVNYFTKLMPMEGGMDEDDDNIEQVIILTTEHVMNLNEHVMNISKQVINLTK